MTNDEALGVIARYESNDSRFNGDASVIRLAREVTRRAELSRQVLELRHEKVHLLQMLRDTEDRGSFATAGLVVVVLANVLLAVLS